MVGAVDGRLVSGARRPRLIQGVSGKFYFLESNTRTCNGRPIVSFLDHISISVLTFPTKKNNGAHGPAKHYGELAALFLPRLDWETTPEYNFLKPLSYTSKECPGISIVQATLRVTGMLGEIRRRFRIQILQDANGAHWCSHYSGHPKKASMIHWKGQASHWSRRQDARIHSWWHIVVYCSACCNC